MNITKESEEMTECSCWLDNMQCKCDYSKVSEEDKKKLEKQVKRLRKDE